MINCFEENLSKERILEEFLFRYNVQVRMLFSRSNCGICITLKDEEVMLVTSYLRFFKLKFSSRSMTRCIRMAKLCAWGVTSML